MCVCARACVYIHTYIHTYTHFFLIRTHTHTHTHTHTRTHAHAHTQVVPESTQDIDSDFAFGDDFLPEHDGEYLTHTWRAAIESTEAFTSAAAVELLGTGFVPGGAVCRWCVQEVLCVSDSYLYGGVQPRIQSWVAAAGGTSMDSVPIVAAEDIQRLDVTTGKPCMLCVGQRFGGTCRHPRIR